MMAAQPIAPALPDANVGIKDLVGVDGNKQTSSNDDADVELVPAKDDDSTTIALSGLAPVDRLIINRRLLWKQALRLNSNNCRFFILDPNEQTVIFSVREEKKFNLALLCASKPRQLIVRNTEDVEVMCIKQDRTNCCRRMLPCRRMCEEVYSPPDKFIGSIEQEWAVCKPQYVVRNSTGDKIFWLHGPKIRCNCVQDVEFLVKNAEGEVVGSSKKQWQGVYHAFFVAPITDTFNVQFPGELKVECKGLLLAATLLLYYLHYEM